MKSEVMKLSEDVVVRLRCSGIQDLFYSFEEDIGSIGLIVDG